MTTFTVTVVNPGSGNKYYIDGVQQASVSLIANNTFTFNQDSATTVSYTHLTLPTNREV